MEMTQLMIPEDRVISLVHKARDGDRQAFEDLVERHRERLKSFARSRIRPHLRERIDLQEIVNDTFARAFESLGRFRGEDEDSFFGWLVGIAKNVVLKATSRLQREDALEIVRDTTASDDATPSKDLRRSERFARLEEAVKGLSGDYKEVILLCRIQGLPVKKAASTLR